MTISKKTLTPKKSFAAKKTSVIDPVTFEVLKNRLWAINDQQAEVALRTSGSLVVYDAKDMNAAITDHEGRGLFLGRFNNTLAATVPLEVKWILANYSRNFIRDGDMFLFNDPWVGSVHHSDYTMVAPVFYGGDIMVWSGVSMHEVDVGGQVPCSMFSGAKSAYEEPQIVVPVKAVERGEIQQDVIRLVTRTSRLPVVLELNLLARVSAIRVANKAILELINRYGKETLLAFTKKLIDNVEEGIVARLRKLPDGIWYDCNYHDSDGISDTTFPLKMAMTKRGGKLIFDFTGTSSQATGFINCASGLLHGQIQVVLLAMLCYGLPYSSGALERLYEVVAEEGSLVNATYPAAVSLGAVGSSWAARQMVNHCVGKMMSCSKEMKEQAIADYTPTWHGGSLDGLDQRGKPFIGVVMEPGGGGGGARTYRDGIDSGGAIDIPGQGIPDIEMTEYNYPQLLLWRRESKDAFGPGKFRGGAGIEFATIPYKSPGPLSYVIISDANFRPGAVGIYGGMPCNNQFYALLKNTNIWKLIKSGEMPTNLHAISGELVVLPPKSRGIMNKEDVLFFIRGGGGGYSDPLFRNPELVEKDVREGLCSLEVARDIFGVIVDPVSLNVDQSATEKRREEILQKRILEGKPVNPVLVKKEKKSSDMPKRVIMPIGDAVRVVRQNSELFFECTNCYNNYGSTKIGDPKKNALMFERSISEVNPWNKYSGRVNEFVVREYYCPQCGIMISANVQKKEEPIMMDMDLSCL